MKLDRRSSCSTLHNKLLKMMLSGPYLIVQRNDKMLSFLYLANTQPHTFHDYSMLNIQVYNTQAHIHKHIYTYHTQVCTHMTTVYILIPLTCTHTAQVCIYNQISPRYSMHTHNTCVPSHKHKCVHTPTPHTHLHLFTYAPMESLIEMWALCSDVNSRTL